ncbi:MAG: STAS domain-containing protein, partial [Nannocystaceae bacterium]
QQLMGLATAEVESAVCNRDAGEFLLAGVLRTPGAGDGESAEAGGDHVAIGYISGWCSALYGQPIVAIELAAKDGEPRRFEARPRSAWGEEAAPWVRALDETEYSLSRELEHKLAVIEEQEAAISELSTPVMEIWDDILLLPIVGVVDTRRSMEIMNNLLESIASTQARCVIIDVTGVEVVDTRTADYLLKVIRAASLLGCRGVLTGLGAAISQTLVEIGADLSEVRTLRSIKEGLRDSLKFLKLPGRSES